MTLRPYIQQMNTYKVMVHDILMVASTTYAATAPDKRQQALNDPLMLSLWTIIALNKVAKDVEAIKLLLP